MSTVVLLVVRSPSAAIPSFYVGTYPYLFPPIPFLLVQGSNSLIIKTYLEGSLYRRGTATYNGGGPMTHGESRDEAGGGGGQQDNRAYRGTSLLRGDSGSWGC
jgi:hypothetical protein